MLSSADRKLLARDIAEELKPHLHVLMGNVLGMEEVRAMLRCPSTDAVRKLCERGRIPSHRFNGRYYFFDTELKEFLMDLDGHVDN